MIEALYKECEKLGYKPRVVQIEATKWLNSMWFSANKCKILSLPVGSGKSLIAKAVSAYNQEKGLKTALITPQNLLIDQYMTEFTDLNFFKGKIHYICDAVKDTCEIGEEISKQLKTPCEECPYLKAKRQCYTRKVTVFNPTSYYLLPKEGIIENNIVDIYNIDTIIIDEMQTLSNFLRQMSTVKLWSHDIQWVSGITASIPKVVDLLYSYVQKLSAYIVHPNLDIKEKVTLMMMQKRIDSIVYNLKTESQYFICEESVEKYKGVDTKCLQIRPKYVPPSVYRSFFNKARHVILMSGTAFPYMWEELGFSNVDKIDLPSPIPKERRLIFATSSITLSAKQKDKLQRWDTMQTLAAQIKEIVHKIHPKESGVVLLPYNLAAELKPLLNDPCFIHMDKASKKTTIQKFLKGEIYGVGIFSGSYEGLSLDNHISRFTIIPKVPFPNLLDKVVASRMADDSLSYSLEAMTLIVQASGRSVRSEKDYGACYILDSNFIRIYSTTRSLLPKYFKESMVFSMPTSAHLANFNKLRKDYDEDVANSKQ